MTAKDVKTIYRKDYKPSGFMIDEIKLHFDLFDHETIVTATSIFRNLDKKKPLALHGDALELLSIAIDDQELTDKDYDMTDEGLVIHKTPANFTLEIKTKIDPDNNTELSGLYRSNDLFCTQCEAEGFRRITYFLDRPDVLTTYTTTIAASVSKCPVLLSNGNLIDSGVLGNGRHFATWHDPFKKPSYLFALVAGDLAHIDDTFTTMSGRLVQLKIYVEHGNESQCYHAMNALKKSFKWDEEVYGREYDLDIFNIVAVSTFNMGAMENKGLNVFNSKYVLAKAETATDADFAAIEGVVAHEYFHNWTGNRVTCRDWFQLSLKEGLTVFRDQEFSRDMNSRSVNRIQDVRALRASQFPEDAGPMAHPVRPESFIEINNFYTSTIYNKGAEVIRMQHTILGERGFRKGMDLYFERHDGQAVTIDDFVAAMEDANDVDFTQMKRWYSQAGTPQVKVKSSIENNTLTLTLSQFCPPTPNQEEKLPFYIPIRVAVFSKDGEPVDIGTELLILNEEKQTYTFNEVPEGAVVSLLRDFSAPIKLKYKQELDNLKHLIQYETDGFARFEAMQTLLKVHVRRMIDCVINDEPLELDSSLVDLFTLLLEDQSMDLLLKAELLQPLDFETLAGELKTVDVHACIQALDFFEKSMGEACEVLFKDVYTLLAKQASQEMNLQAYGERRVKNVCLNYLAKTTRHAELIKTQFHQAKTMTDELQAFRLLVDCEDELAAEATEHFYNKWQEEDLVLDKWFQTQAISSKASTLSHVKSLLEHTAFSIKNPNKVRALVGAFAMANPRHFHTVDGYTFLTDFIIKLDTLNPQVAARLVTPLTRWRRYTEETQDLMKVQLQRLLDDENLSKDTYEIVSKSL